MAVYSFSTKSKKPEDDEVVQSVKEYCEQHSLNFSSVIVNLLAKYASEVVNVERA